MSRTPDAEGARPGAGRDPGGAAADAASADAPPRVLVVDADAALYGLLEEWLSGCALEQAVPGSPAGRYDLIVAVIRFPRRGSATLCRIGREQAGTPIVALSSSFFPGIEPGGAVAQGLGVDAVLPIPFSREALLGAVRRGLRLPP